MYLSVSCGQDSALQMEVISPLQKTYPLTRTLRCYPDCPVVEFTRKVYTSSLARTFANILRWLASHSAQVFCKVLLCILLSIDTLFLSVTRQSHTSHPPMQLSHSSMRDSFSIFFFLNHRVQSVLPTGMLIGLILCRKTTPVLVCVQCPCYDKKPVVHSVLS